MPVTAETRKKVDLKITTQPDSTVYLLALDKHFNQGNEITKDDVIKELIDYDGTNQVTVFDIKDTNWHECDAKELNRVSRGRQLTFDTGENEYSATQDKDMDEDVEELEQINQRNENENQTSVIEADNISENFREVWLFEEFEVPDGSMTKQFITPDLTTSWMISSFSMNDKHGLAFAQPKELIAKSQFYIQTFFPFKIKFGEVIKVDVMVYNNINNKEALDVKVTIYDADNIKSLTFYDNECSSKPNNDTKPLKSIQVPYDNVRRVSFYIQANSDKTAYTKFIRIRIDSNAITQNGEVYMDKKMRGLRVEPIGVKNYQITSKSYNLEQGKILQDIFSLQDKINSEEYPKITFEVAGDYLTDDSIMSFQLVFT